MLVVLFTSIFTTMSVIEDRHAGFLQAVMVAPASRSALVVGKTLGGTTIALIQVALFLALAPLAGFPLMSIDWPMLLLMATLTSTGLTATGFAIAWWLDSIQGYHAIMSVLLLPLWILSGSMFPAREGGFMGTLMHLNPMSYASEGISLTDQHGRAVHLEDLAGKTWVADFIFTSCQAACPMLTSRMRTLQRYIDEREHALGHDMGMRLVSFSVDPEVDTPEKLAAY